MMSDLLQKFQSTHPQGVRLDHPQCQSFAAISIHAPTKGATLCTFDRRKIDTDFNPRTHEGCDCLRPISMNGIPLFQPTHPRGVRHLLLRHRSGSCNFNPRTREGCDHAEKRFDLFRVLSIHAPTRGATFRESEIIPATLISIHAPTKVATNDQELCR